MSGQESRLLGQWGEDRAAECLRKKGFQVTGANWKCRFGEIDLIARDPAGVLCFVEVKTRSPRAIAPPREAVTAAKQRRLRDAASWYLARTGWDGPCRFDVAEVYSAGAEGRRQIKYITSAFQ